MEKHLKNMKNKKYPERFSGKASFFFPHPGAESFILCTSDRFFPPRKREKVKARETKKT